MTESSTLIPTQLFIGSDNEVTQHVEQFLQKQFCPNKQVDCFCVECRKVKNRQHHSIVWINPEKDYVVSDVEVVFDKIRFALEEGQSFFFILEKVHTLNAATANRLLKVLEEPPDGYHFILTANNPNAVLPTILSRCHLVNLASSEPPSIVVNPILQFFYEPDRFGSPIEFERELRQQHLSGNQSIELANEMICYFSQKIIDLYKLPEAERDCLKIQKLETVVDFFKDKMAKPPQSGSSTIFWKNLFLQFPGI